MLDGFPRQGKCKECGTDYDRQNPKHIRCYDCAYPQQACQICGKEYRVKRNHLLLRKTCGMGCAKKYWSKTRQGRLVKEGIEYSMGYRYVWNPTHPKAHKNKVAEHRLVAEQIIGRYLRKDEVVHHINGDKTDNRPENLLVTNRAWHLLHHDPKGWRRNEKT